MSYTTPTIKALSLVFRFNGSRKAARRHTQKQLNRNRKRWNDNTSKPSEIFNDFIYLTRVKNILKQIP